MACSSLIVRLVLGKRKVEALKLRREVAKYGPMVEKC
jgi:NifU-like protein involved in Fe-S cluster formation